MCKGKVLIAEDDRVQVALLTEDLEQEGYEVLSYVDGADIVDMVIKECPEIILLDVHLPNVSGWEIARQLKKDHRTRDIPISIVSSIPKNEGMELARQYGCFDFFSKPTDTKTILKSIAKNLIVGRMKKRISGMIDKI